jgi:hypothetical protein
MTIYRGPGGGGNATTDSQLNALTVIAAEALASALVSADAATATAGSVSAAATSAGNASTSAAAALVSENNAAASYDAFDDRYLGAKGTAPTLDNDGNTLLVGALYYDTSLFKMQVWSGSTWNPIGSGGATGSLGNNAFFENEYVVSQNYTISTGKNAMSSGPMTINSGIVVTVPAGSVWNIV